jgi:hypothetical protein
LVHRLAGPMPRFRAYARPGTGQWSMRTVDHDGGMRSEPGSERAC